MEACQPGQEEVPQPGPAVACQLAQGVACRLDRAVGYQLAPAAVCRRDLAVGYQLVLGVGYQLALEVACQLVPEEAYQLDRHFTSVTSPLGLSSNESSGNEAWSISLTKFVSGGRKYELYSTYSSRPQTGLVGALKSELRAEQ